MNGVVCKFYGSDIPVGFTKTPYPELFDRIEIDASLTGINENLDINIIIPIKTTNSDDEKLDGRAWGFGGINSND